MTERLYYTEPSRRGFTARVVALEDGGRRLYLDRTAFYPTSGGQPHDVGTIAGVPVTDVVDEEERIAHVLAAPLGDGSVGATVEGAIDWARRHDHMQQHTGQHLLSAVLADLFGLATVSVHFGPDVSTLDVARSETEQTSLLGDEDLRSAESRANELVAEALPVRVSFEEADAVTGLRKATDRSGTLRVVTIEGVDRSACGGTHVASSSEIGPVLLRRQERIRSAIRIEFVCGHRAIARARRDFEVLSRIARAQSASLDDVGALVETLAGQLRDLQAENRRLTEALATHRAAEWYRETTAGGDGLRRLVDRPAAGGADTGRALALAAASLPGVLCIVAANDPPSVLVASSADSGIDAGRVLKPLLAQVGGRGGGSPRLAQGAAPSPAAVDIVVEGLLSVTRPG